MGTDVELELLKKTLTDCQIEELVGKSSLGTQYHIHHNVYGDCTLKYFTDTVMDNQQILTLLQSEVEDAKNILHPSFARIYSFSSDPIPFVIREWIPGENFEEALTRGPLSPLQAAKFMIELAWGIQAAYNLGLRHKNLKPTNLIMRGGSVTLVDALLPPTVPHYLSPEHLSGKNSDVRSDIYSSGIIFYQALSGHLPFTGTLSQVKKLQLAAAPPHIPKMPPKIQEVLDKCLAKKPEERYRNPLEFIEDLQKAVQEIFQIPPTDLSKTSSLPAEDKKKMGMSKRTTGMAKRSLDEATMMITPQDVERMGGTLEPESAREITAEIADVIAELDEEARAGSKFQDTHKYSPKTEVLQEATSEIPDTTAEEGKDGEEEPHIKEGDMLSKIDEIEQADITEDLEGGIVISPDFGHLPPGIPENLQKTLLMATDVKSLKYHGEVLAYFNLVCPLKWKKAFLEYLQTVLRRECWTVKEIEGSEEIEIAIDLELAKTLRYFNYLEDKLQNVLANLAQLSTIQKTIVARVENLNEESLAESLDGKSGSGRSSVYSAIDTIMDSIQGASLKPAEGKLSGTDSVYMPTDKGDSTSYHEIDPPQGKANAMEIMVNFNNPYQTRAWLKLVKEHNWEKGKHFDLKQQAGSQNLKNACFKINLHELQQHEKKRVGISSVKEFFQGDYDIARLDQGGMAAVLKLTTKDTTILFLRPENHWAREKFAPYLVVRQGADGQECIYAEIPKGTEFVVKLAFQGREEALIYESRLLSTLAQDPQIARHIIGMIQQGTFLSSGGSESSQEQLGYYLMLEYASLSNVEHFSRRFPENRLPISIAFTIMYSMVITLQHLKTKGIIHRDIKPQNILLDSNAVAKLSDFGLAITVAEAGYQLNEERRRLLRLVDSEFLQITSEKEQAEARLKKTKEKLIRLGYPPQQKEFEDISYQITGLNTQIDKLMDMERARAEGLRERYRPMSAEEIAIKGEFAGSLYYAAPEQFSPSKVLTWQCDVYQLGAVSYAMLTGKPPVKGRNIMEVMGQIMVEQKIKVADIIRGNPVVDVVSELVRKMMTKNPEQRVTIEQVREIMDQILVDHYQELQEPPVLTKPTKWKNEREESKWKQKVEHATQLHQLMLPQLEEFFMVSAKTKLKSKAKAVQQPSMQRDPEGCITLVFKQSPGDEIRFRCPNCKRKLQIPADRLGKKFRCPNCQQRLMVKVAAAPS